ncbi:hypothetical protein [Streptomyces sp. NPDC058412]|uniref:hypothetical protein n=1 Tax=Streptomyces sp. NPDC058412 TaxID=3346486 RepID=UPI0036691588
MKGASSVHTPERPTATVEEVYALAEAIQPRYRALVSIPGVILPDLHEHLKRYAEAGADGCVFVGAKRATPRCIFMTFGRRATRSPRQQVPAQGS